LRAEDLEQRVEFITNRQIYEKVICGAIPSASLFVWLATSDLKDLYVEKGRKKMVPFLEIIADLLKKGVKVRLIHAKQPGPAFRTDFDRYSELAEGLERLLCPRIHFKSVVVDGTFAYSGSANLTGAGMGAKSESRRNFEAGFITSDKYLVDQIAKQFDELWMGKFCLTCQRKQFCTEFREMN
jgi:phosphatidylserine/phosphatidylglycerophosphate/cardiolipin synthase-like enzyme